MWRSWEYKETAAEALKLTAEDLVSVGVVDAIIPEPIGGAHRDPATMFTTMRETLVRELLLLRNKDTDSLVRERREKFYRMGVWVE